MGRMKRLAFFLSIAFMILFPKTCLAADGPLLSPLMKAGIFFGGLAVFTILFFIFYKKYVEKQWIEFSKEVNMQLLYCNAFEPNFALTGEYNGRTCKTMTLKEMRFVNPLLDSRHGPRDKREIIYTRVKLWADTSLNIDLRLDIEGITEKIKKKMGNENEIEIGSAKFDSAFLIRCNNLDHMDDIVKILTPKVQAAILATAGIFTRDRYKFEVTKDLIEVECSSYSTSQTRKMLHAAQCMAEVMESYKPG